MNLNVSLALNDDWTSIGIKADDTDGLNLDYYEEGKNAEDVIQNAIQEFLTDYLASYKKQEEKSKIEPQKKLTNEDLFSALDDLFENEDEEIDDLFDEFDRSFFGEPKWSHMNNKSAKEILNGDEEEESYGGFNSWEEERQSLLDDLDDMTEQFSNQKQDYNKLKDNYDDLLTEIKKIKDKMQELASLL